MAGTNKIEGMDELVEAIRSIAMGKTFSFDSGEKLQATGLEALSIAMAGNGFEHPVGEAIKEAGSDIAEAINNLADAISMFRIKS